MDHDQQLPSPRIAKTPQSILRSARKIIPGLEMSDDLPIGLTQAFAATMADSGSEDEEIAVEEQGPWHRPVIVLHLASVLFLPSIDSSHWMS